MIRARLYFSLLLVIPFQVICCCDSNAQSTISRLLEIEKRVTQVVSKNMEHCVAVTDGIGFGSGVVVSEDGLVLTAGHVMTSEGDFEIIFPSGRRARAKPRGKNLNIDAGMLQIVEEGPWPHADIATSPAQLGDWVVNIGHSGGFELGRKPPVRTGRYLRRRGHQLVSDAVLIGGDSGGPLFNLDGDLIGIHSSIGDSIAENRHVNIMEFKKHWTRMKRGDSWGQLPTLGSPSKPVKKRARLGVKVDRNSDRATITRVNPGSPADRIGLLANDIVTEFDGARISNSAQLIDLIKRKKPGDKCSITVERNGAIYRYRIHLGSMSG